jgi:DNA-binding winged helix-turn-helix (wHTH) protein
MSATRETRVFRFGVFELEEASGELRKQGRRLRLQGQPGQVLLMLVERSGEVVSREELRLRLWAEGTYVDFDHGLNTAINKLREALSDPASNPRFIETIPKRGYRFIAPVEVASPPGMAQILVPPEAAGSSPLSSAASITGADPSSDSAASSAKILDHILTPPEAMPRPPHALVRTLFLLIQLMYLCFYTISLARLGAVEQIVAGMAAYSRQIFILLVVTAAVGIPGRLYLIAAVAFRAPGAEENYRKLFSVLLLLDALWALAPFLLWRQIGPGLALGATAALLYLPFAQRSLILMGAGRVHGE